MKKKLWISFLIIFCISIIYFLLKTEFIRKDFGSVELQIFDCDGNTLENIRTISFLNTRYNDNILGIPIPEKSHFPMKNIKNLISQQDGRIFLNYDEIMLHLNEYYTTDIIFINLIPKDENMNVNDFLENLPWSEFKTFDENFKTAVIIFNYEDSKLTQWYKNKYNTSVFNLTRDFGVKKRIKITLCKEEVKIE